MKKLLPFLFVLTAMLFTLGCCCTGKCNKAPATQNVTGQRDYPAEGFTKATVIDYQLDGCKWMLKLENGDMLLPSPPPAERFQKDQIPVWVKYEVVKGGMSTCMAGTMVKVTAIEERK